MYINWPFPAHLVNYFFIFTLPRPFSDLPWLLLFDIVNYKKLSKDSQKIDEGVKISKSNTLPNVQEMADLRIVQVLL